MHATRHHTQAPAARAHDPVPRLARPAPAEAADEDEDEIDIPEFADVMPGHAVSEGLVMLALSALIGVGASLIFGLV